ncbi:MAG: ubiquinone biosynthesis protein [Frankiales bacterium]|nr:ubiquinone biosynthesis protein [Frankiales bacterium]
MDMSQLQSDWERFGDADPMWAILSDPSKRGSWDPVQFFASGRGQVQGVMATVDQKYPGLSHGDALDFGCGLGRLTQPLAELFQRAVGVDISEPMVVQARQLNQAGDRCQFVHNTRADLQQFPDESFDLVYSHIVLQHIPQPFTKAYLAEFRRVLRPGGVATFTLPSHPAPTLRGTVYRLLPFGLINAYKRRRDGALMAMHSIRRTHLEAHLRSVGFQVDDVVQDSSGGPNWVSYRYFVSRGAD